MRYFNFKFIWGKLNMFKKLTTFLTLVFLAHVVMALTEVTMQKLLQHQHQHLCQRQRQHRRQRQRQHRRRHQSLRLSQLRSLLLSLLQSQRLNLHLSATPALGVTFADDLKVMLMQQILLHGCIQ